MAQLDLSIYDPMLKDHYADGEVAKMAFQKNKALGMLRKKAKQVGGKKWVQPFGYALPGGGSGDFATAMAANNNTSLYEAWEVTRKRHYRIAKVDNETIQASSTGNIDAFEKAFDEFDRAMDAEANWINFRFFRGGNGAIGRMTNSSFATTVLTLDEPAGSWGARQGDVLKLTAAADGSALKAGEVTVQSVQRTAGTLTLTGTIAAGIATAAVNDYVSLKGDAAVAPQGLADWVPDTAPSSTLFNGVDRTAEPEYMGGIRIDATDGRSIPNALIDAVVAIDDIGGDPDVVFMNGITFGTLTKQIEGKWTSTSAAGYDGKKYATIGYRGFTVDVNGHALTIFTDRTCPRKRIYVLTWSSWTMFSAGPAPMFLQKAAGSIIKVSESSDSYEARVGEYMNFCTDTPGWNAVIILAN